MNIMSVIAFLFYLLIGLWAFGVAFPGMMIILGICALVLAFKSLPV